MRTGYTYLTLCIHSLTEFHNQVFKLPGKSIFNVQISKSKFCLIFCDTKTPFFQDVSAQPRNVLTNDSMKVFFYFKLYPRPSIYVGRGTLIHLHFSVPFNLKIPPFEDNDFTE